MQNQMNSSQDKEVFQMPVPIFAHQLHGVSQHGFRPQRQFSNTNECLSVLKAYHVSHHLSFQLCVSRAMMRFVVCPKLLLTS